MAEAATNACVSSDKKYGKLVSPRVRLEPGSLRSWVWNRLQLLLLSSSCGGGVTSGAKPGSPDIHRNVHVANLTASASLYIRPTALRKRMLSRRRSHGSLTDLISWLNLPDAINRHYTMTCLTVFARTNRKRRSQTTFLWLEGRVVPVPQHRQVNPVTLGQPQLLHVCTYLIFLGCTTSSFESSIQRSCSENGLKHSQ